MHESNHLAHRQELVLLDLKNPRSIASLMPEAFARQMENLWNSDDAPLLLGLTERQLIRELIRRKKTPAPIDHKLRVKFWIEFERVQVDVPKMAKMNMHNILGLDFPKETFYRFYITDREKLAFLLCPPTDYEEMIDVVLTMSTYKLIEILETPAMHPGARCADPNLIKKFMEINEAMHRRKLQLEYKSGGGKIAGGRRRDDDQESEGAGRVPAAEPQTEAEMQAELEAIEAKLKKLPGQV